MKIMFLSEITKIDEAKQNRIKVYILSRKHIIE